MRAIMAQSTMPSWLAGRRATTDWGKGSSMSENTRLTAVLGEICVLLEKHGNPDFALRLKGQRKSWLKRRSHLTSLRRCARDFMEQSLGWVAWRTFGWRRQLMQSRSAPKKRLPR